MDDLKQTLERLDLTSDDLLALWRRTVPAARDQLVTSLFLSHPSCSRELFRLVIGESDPRAVSKAAARRASSRLRNVSQVDVDLMRARLESPLAPPSSVRMQPRKVVPPELPPRRLPPGLHEEPSPEGRASEAQELDRFPFDWTAARDWDEARNLAMRATPRRPYGILAEEAPSVFSWSWYWFATREELLEFVIEDQIRWSEEQGDDFPDEWGISPLADEDDLEDEGVRERVRAERRKRIAKKVPLKKCRGLGLGGGTIKWIGELDELRRGNSRAARKCRRDFWSNRLGDDITGIQAAAAIEDADVLEFLASLDEG